MISRPTMAITKSPADSVQDVLRDPELQRLLTHPEHQGLELAHSRQIYTNRSLKMEEIALVGFDMDYTLAVYSMRQIEELAFHMTLARMVQKRGYPAPLEKLKYDHEFVIRGLVVDKDFGNIFKMDRHNHVGRCYHGRRQLSFDERRALYQTNEKIRLSLPRFAWIDTLFSLPEACLYAEIIEAQEAAGEKVDYHKLYDDVPVPSGGPNSSRLVALSNQVSPAASAMTRALLSIGTTEKSKLSSVLLGSRRASARLRSVRLRPRSAISSSASAERNCAAGQPSLSARSANSGQSLAIAGRRRSCSSSGRRVVSTWIALMTAAPSGERLARRHRPSPPVS